MSHLFPNYNRLPFELVKGEGSYVEDGTGKKYLDFTSGIGVTSLGHCHPKVMQAVQKQLDQLWHMPNLYESQLQEEVAQLLANSQDYAAFFCNSGAEANEAAIKLARRATGKSKIITFINSFHGRTYGSMSATAQASIQAGFEPLVPGFEYVAFNDLAALEAVLDDQTAAVMTELVQGESGVLPADQAWATGLQKLCKQNGILLIVDEVQTGLGRTGNLYCYENYGLSPDIVTLAKALGNGLPVGAMLGKSNLAAAFSPGRHGSTFGGNKVALAAAKVVVETINTPEFLKMIQEKGAYLQEKLRTTLAANPHVTNIRGQGLMVGIETTQSLPEIMEALRKENLLVLRAGQNVIRLLPALTVSQEEMDLAVKKLTKVFNAAN